MYQKTSDRSEAASNSASQVGEKAKTLPAVQPAQMMTEEAGTVQKAEEEKEDALQGKFATVQKAEEEKEDALQGKFETVQKAEEEKEEPLQGKFETAQLMEEEKDGEALQMMEEEKDGDALQMMEEEKDPLQGKFDPIQKAEEEKEGSMDAAGGEDEKEIMQGKFHTVQRRANSSGPFQLKKNSSKQGLVQRKEAAIALNQTGMPNALKSGIETLSGFAMNDVKVHYNSDKPKQLKAYAYAQGTDIHVAPGQEKHLAHEAWHVAQQKQGRVQPTVQMKQGVPVNDDTSLETEADVMGAKAMALGTKQENGTNVAK